MMPTPVLRLVNDDGELSDVLNGWTELSIGGGLGEQMVLEMQYQSGSVTYPLLADNATVAVTLGGEEIPDGRFLIDATEDEEVLPADAVKRAGNSLLFQLNYAVVFPKSDPVDGQNTSTPGWGFDSYSPGHALRELLEAAQTRGWWPDLEWDFTDGLDSAGVAWSTNISEFVDQGTDLLTVVQKWTTRQVAVARMVGDTLQLFRYDTSGFDRTLDVQLLRDVDLTEGPVQRTSRNTVSVILGVTDGVEGETGFGTVRTNNPTLTKYGHREGFVSQSQIADLSTLQSIVDGTLALKARQREAFTYGLTCAGRDRRPFIDWDRGDQVSLRVAGQDGEARVMRVRQLSVLWRESGEVEASAAFGDRKLAADEALASRLEQLTNGSMDAGAYGQPVVGSQEAANEDGGGGDTSPDAMPPAPPTGLTESTAAVFNQGYLSATATVEWTAPGTNQDGSDLQDLGGYEVQYRHAGFTNWEFAARVDKDTELAVIPRLTVDEDYEVRVRAFDIWSNASDWVTDSFTATNDAAPPAEQPSAPVVATFLFSGLMVTWDGKAQGGTAIDNDIRHVEVHVSTASGFTPGAGTLKDRIDIGGGSTVVGELTPGTTYYVRFKSVDWAGNPGPVSNQTTGVPDSVQTGDIANGAVTDGKMTSLSVTKLTAGTLSAVVTLSGEFRTAASGQRVVINASGVKLYDPASNVVVNLDATTGEGTFNGVLGAMNLTGYVKIDSGTGPFIQMQTFGSVPAIAMSTGRLIEKYPAYMFTTSDAFLRTLAMRINAPGSNYAGGDSTTYDYPQLTLITVPYDGDFANATTLPTRIWGSFRFTLPAGDISRISNKPSFTIMNRYTSGSSDTFHQYPGWALKDGMSPSHEAGIRLEHTATAFNAVRLAVVKHDAAGNVANALCDMIGLSFTNPSGRAMKSEIASIPYSALQVIRDNPSLRWRYTQEANRFELGPMADGLPPEIRQEDPNGDLFVRPGSMIGLLWKAIEELLEKIDAMGATP